MKKEKEYWVVKIDWYPEYQFLIKKQEIKLVMDMKEILKQGYTVTNKFNFEMFLESIKSQVSSKIFDELIQKEKHGLEIIFTVNLIE